MLTYPRMPWYEDRSSWCQGREVDWTNRLSRGESWRLRRKKEFVKKGEDNPTIMGNMLWTYLLT